MITDLQRVSALTVAAKLSYDGELHPDISDQEYKNAVKNALGKLGVAESAIASRAEDFTNRYEFKIALQSNTGVGMVALENIKTGDIVVSADGTGLMGTPEQRAADLFRPGVRNPPARSPRIAR